MRKEPTRVREHGTKVTAPRNHLERILAVRDIVKHKQYAKIDGVLVDGFTASAIVAVYDALNPDNQRLFASFDIRKMGRIAYKLVK